MPLSDDIDKAPPWARKLIIGALVAAVLWLANRTLASYEKRLADLERDSEATKIWQAKIEARR